MELTLERVRGLVAYREQRDFRVIGKIGNVLNEKVHALMNAIKRFICTCTFVTICLLVDIFKCLYNDTLITNQLHEEPNIYPTWFPYEFRKISQNIEKPPILINTKLNHSLLNLTNCYKQFAQNCKSFAQKRKLHFDYKKTNAQTKRSIQSAINIYSPNYIDAEIIARIQQKTKAKPTSIVHRLLSNAVTLRLVTLCQYHGCEQLLQDVIQ